MASRGKTTQLSHMYVADFETCDSVPNGNNHTPQKVWLAGHKNLQTMKSTYFTNLTDFMNDILSQSDNRNTEYGFHNLAFDGSFIVPWLLTNGYDSTNTEPKPKQFSVLVDNRNQWYSITIKVNKRKKVTLWCTQKLFPTPLAYLHEVYGTPTKKLTEPPEFYERYRPDGHVPDEEEMAYFENDLQVPAETLNRHIERYGLRFKKTQASQSFYNFEQSFKAWKRRFPPLTIEQDEAIRPAYWGGISYVPPSKAGKDFYEIGSYDINSSYPHKAAEKRLPYGKPIAEYGEGKHPIMSKFWIAEALVRFKLKPNCIPCIPASKILEGRPKNDNSKWIADSQGIVKIRFCNIDYQTIQQSYDFEVVRWKWSIHWKWKVHKEIAKFVHNNNDNKVKYKKLAKETEDEDKKIEYLTISNRAKIDNNSFYGKFGEEIVKIGKTPYLDEDGEDVYWEMDREDIQSEGKRKFLPVAIAITAWGRQQLVEMANTLGEDFLYCDTDSIHFLRKGQHKIDKAIKDGKFEVDPTKLGAWDYEGSYIRGRYLRSKCYMEETEEGDLLSTVAGLPPDPGTGRFSKKRSYLNWDNFHIGLNVPSECSHKLRTVRTPTGNKLVPIDFTITEHENPFTI